MNKIKRELPEIIDKPWGHEIIHAFNNKYAGKVLFIKKGEETSLQYHNKKTETMFIFHGKILFNNGKHEELCEECDIINIKPKTKHRVKAVEDTYILETSTPELDDVVRLEDKYNRI